MLEIKNLSKNFNGKKVLDSINLKVERGEVAILLGASGVGKSTLLRVLNNLEAADTGTIILDNKVLDWSQIHERHVVGMVFQQFNLFENLTVQENITLALEKVLNKSKKGAQEIAYKLLKSYGLEDKSSWPVSRLSGGQKQRLALARTLALHPQIICLDEPTSALDPLLKTFVAQNITSLAQDNYIVLVATHDIALIEKLDCTIYFMDNGSIVEKARAVELLEHPDAYPKIQKFIKGH